MIQPPLWDAVVVGAGIAGATVAHGLAKCGWRVLLVERSAHPRAKTCGGCLHPLGVRLLTEHFGEHAVPGAAYTVAELRSETQARRSFPLSNPFRFVDRTILDPQLVRSAIAAGVTYLDHCTVLSTLKTSGERAVTVRLADGRTEQLRAKVVIASDGLRSGLAAAENLLKEATPLWRQKLGFSAEATGNADLNPAAVTMLCNAWGYLGIVHVRENQWHLAAAVEPAAVKQGGVISLLRRTLYQHGLYGIQPAEASIATAPSLTRRLRAPAAERILFVGDAAGYLEPITGEGMTWALSSATAAIDCLAQGWGEETAAVYTARWRRDVEARQRWVKAAATALDRPFLRRVVFGALGSHPSVGCFAGRLASGGIA